MNEQYAELITKFPLFEGHTVAGAQFLVERGEVKEHAPGEILCLEGDPPTFVLLVLSGKVQVSVEREGKTLLLAEPGPGAILGELAVLCGIPRAASLRASEKVVALHWEKEAFRRMLLSNSFLSERILRQSLRTLIEKEQALIEDLGRKGGSSSHGG
jgi:CRP-like cAMP-binding protein